MAAVDKTRPPAAMAETDRGCPRGGTGDGGRDPLDGDVPSNIRKAGDCCEGEGCGDGEGV
jgi:hypothetical protein